MSSVLLALLLVQPVHADAVGTPPPDDPEPADTEASENRDDPAPADAEASESSGDPAATPRTLLELLDEVSPQAGDDPPPAHEPPPQTPKELRKRLRRIDRLCKSWCGTCTHLCMMELNPHYAAHRHALEATLDDEPDTDAEPTP